VNANVHFVQTPTSKTGGGKACDVPTATTAYHTYTLEWTPQTLTFIYDDATCWVTTWSPMSRYAPRGSTAPTPFDQPFYLIINLAVGDYHTPRNQPDRRTVFPAVMSVDYIRVWS
jgi:beta-glucanase (GH16 family)